MKRFKSVVALILAAVLLTSTALAVQFPDVDPNSTIGKAVDYLSNLGVLGGYEDGTFKPDATVTRAQFAKIVYMMENQGTTDPNADAYKGNSAFFDVAANQWFSGYVNWAYQRKIIGGMGDGTFQPDGTLTYAQAIKMYVVASGVDDSGYSYPNDYIAKATELGILNNVYYGNPNDGASRGNIAVMGYNKLTGGTTPGGAVPGYSFAPQVPDFGAMLGIAMSDSEDTGTMIMCAYILDGKYPTAEEQYKQALADFGFQFIISDEVDGVLMHGYALNGDITDYRVLYAYDSSVMVIGVIRPNSQQVPNQYYTEHPDILNFGTYTGVPLYYQENYEGFDFYFYDIYHPNYSKDKAYSYMNELENTGYLFDFSYKDSDGMTMNVFTKGIQSVVIGATFIENHPFVMVMVPPPNTRSVSVYRSAVGHVQIAADEFQNEQVQLGRKYGSLF